MKIPGNLRLAITHYAKVADQLDSDERLLQRVMSMKTADVSTKQYETASELANIIRQERDELLKDFARLWLTKKGR